MRCSSCGADNRPGRRFCSNCGTALGVNCAQCGAASRPGDRFCGACGAALAPAGAVSTAPSAPLVSERRLVTVLFADLVGFTPLSERRDAEEVRDLLSRYFDRCRVLIERYGGGVSKFIGDAVMAVWGAPVAREDDAERAVRAALMLTAEVAALGAEVGTPGLCLRVGVLTGQAAVEVGAEGEGMVLGDTVNTASRLQSIAPPGSVLVDDVTRRASESAVEYEDAGQHSVKGRDRPVRAWTALRVVAGVGGRRRRPGVEAPFVGRERELAALIDMAEYSASEGVAGHVTVIGEAGAGKSRLLWEFFKYLDGVDVQRFWHEGRCLSYGEGVAYFALAEMVRGRAGIRDEDSSAVAREKLHRAVLEYVPDERERRLIEPRLAHLLRFEERPGADRADLFSGWRLFFERLAADRPVVLAFEDLQWADSGLLDFIDHLLEWSAGTRIMVVTLGRFELSEKRPHWTRLTLEPIDHAAITALLDGLAPGLPAELVDEISRRAEGIPLYAVETVRMLQDRGLVVQEGHRYVVSGDVSDLEVPETLHALVASRLDGLTADERSLLQTAAVLGQSFPVAAAAALWERSEAKVTGLLDGLVTKQVLGRDDDPRSPEQGQYVFLQGLVRTVAYNTLARRTRKARHLQAAGYLRRTWPGQLADIAEMLAAHYMEAIRADPQADDVGELQALAREMLTAAGRAAASLGLGPEASRYFEQAAEFTEEELERAGLLEAAGRALWRSADPVGAEQRLRRAIELNQRNGIASGGSAAVTLATVIRIAGRLEEARSLLEPVRTERDPGISPVVHAEALAALATSLMFGGALEEARPLFDEALRTLELEQAWPALADALVGHGVLLWFEHRVQEALAVFRHALALATEHDLTAVALRARYDLTGLWLESDRFPESIREAEEGLALARERGDRGWERSLLGQSVVPLVVLGRWDEAAATATTLISGRDDRDAILAGLFLSNIATARGDHDTLGRCLALAAAKLNSADVEQRDWAAIIMARAALEKGEPREALAHARPVLQAKATVAETVEEAYGVCIEAALALSDLRVMGELEAFVTALPPARATPLLCAGAARLAAEQAHQRRDLAQAQASEMEAIELLRTAGARPLLARALDDRARRRADPEALAQAQAIYDELGARSWRARSERDRASATGVRASSAAPLTAH
jgi:class 3 adenylate cyclase/tetratricopeptide (TPR) repeat protein